MKSQPRIDAILMFGEPHIDIEHEIQDVHIGKNYTRIFLSNDSSIWVGINEKDEFKALWEPNNK